MKFKNFNIIFVGDEILKDYAGMNYFSSQKMGFPWKWSKNTILIDKNLNKRKKKETIIHEIEEIRHMRSGKAYWPSHLKALEKEKRR